MKNAQAHQELPRQAESAQCTCPGEFARLLKAPEKGCLKCCAKFIDQASQTANNKTALRAAAHYGRVDAARLLLPLEATMQARDGSTALIHAAVVSHTEIARLLIPEEAKMRDNSGSTALIHAIG